ncbi:MAG: hypothetical protein Fur005_33530 [Roseiflexaceae bacterium]
MHAIPGDTLAQALLQALGRMPLEPTVAAPQSNPIQYLGPANMPADQVEQLIRQLLTNPQIVAATPPGLTKSRLAACLPTHARQHANAIMLWFDQAGILLDPRSEALRYREPRMFCQLDLDWIMARLRGNQDAA